MNPGRELDALIAQKVFGFKLIDQAQLGRKDKWYWHGEATVLVPPYSSHIVAAWQVVEKLKIIKAPDYTDELNDMPIFVRFLPYEGKWEAGWARSYYQQAYLCEADTAPHAICLAALKAMGAL